MMLKSSSYKQSNHIVSHSFDIQQSQTQSFNNASHNSFQQNKNISQPELESQELFFQASLQFIRKKKIDNYFLFNDDLIGQGSFAKVYKGMNTLTNQIVAIKVMQIRDIMENKLYGLVEAEMQIIKSLKHPNVLRCYDILITDNNCYIVTQYCEDGELKQYIKKQLKNNKSHEQDNSMLNLITLQPLIYDIYQGLLYLERKSIIHRDIKMSNILIKNGKAKIADFGLAAFSKKEGQIFIDVKVGSPIYMSPQAFLDSIYGPKTDVWAFGILLFEFFHGITPFQRCRNTKQLEIEISKPFEESKIIANISENAKRLICMCLSHQLQDRPSFKDLWGEEYIKCLRLKSYVSSKGLSNYKQTAMQTLRKQVQKNKSQKKLQKTFQTSQSLSILKISGDLQIDSSKVQFQKFEDKQQEKQLKEEGYSFEDFLKMNSQEQQKSQITVENSKSEQKINCHQINLDPQVSNLPLFQNSKQNHSKSFEDEMEEFYRQAQRMMVQQNFIKQSSSQSSQKVPNDQSVRQLKMLDDKNKVQQKKEQMIGNEMTQIKTQTLKQKYSSTKEIISIKNEIQDNFCMDKQETFNSDDKSFDKSIKSLSKARKINLNKNYCQFQQKQQNITLQYEALTQINEQNVQNPKIEEQKICNQEISQTFSNSQKCNDLQTQNFIQNESVSNQCNKNITQISSTILDNQKQKQKEQTKNISPVKVNLNDSVHRQNLKKFTNILKRKQSHQPYDIIKPKQNLYKKPSKNKKQSQDIDLILVLLEFVRFIVKYIKFLKIIKDSALTQKISLQFTNQNQTKYNGENSIKIWEKYQQLFNAQRKSDVICQKLHSFCKQILMKKVSQIIFTLNSQKSSELFQIVKTHKSLLNGLKISDNPLKYNIYNYMTFFEQIFQDVKQIQDILTIFVDQNLERSQSQSLDLMIESLCWQGLWLSKTYDTFLQLQKYLNPGGKAEYQFNSKSQDLKSIMKQLQQFVENYQKVQLHLTSQDLQQSQKQFSNENQTQRIKNNINFFFQLVYEVQLRKMNSINL